MGCAVFLRIFRLILEVKKNRFYGNCVNSLFDRHGCPRRRVFGFHKQHELGRLAAELKAWSAFRAGLDRLFRTGTLSPDVRYLTLIATAAPLKSLVGLKWLLQRAVDAGVSGPAIYEVLLQTYLFAGFPAAIDALGVWRSLHQGSVPVPAPDDSVPETEWASLGEALCRTVYGDRFERLRERMNDLSAELASWMISEGYGKVLSRPGLSAPVRELCAVGALLALGRADQLQAHIRGAINVGASREQVGEVIRQAWCLCGWPAVIEALELYDRLSPSGPAHRLA